MNKMSEATQTLEQTLNKTDLGHTIYENRKFFFVLLLAILISATGFILWKQSKKASELETSVEVFEFQSKVWETFKNGKSTSADLVAAFDKLDSKVHSAPVMLPLALEMAKSLHEKGNDQEAESILSKVSSHTSHPVSAFFIGMQRAVILEKLGKMDEAIKVIEPLAQNKDILMPARVSLELGRLYLLKGDKEKAKVQFEYINSTFPNDDQAKLARLYLSQLSK